MRGSVVAVCAALVLAASTAAQVAAAPIHYHATLRPASVVSDSGDPDQGDSDGFGQMSVTLDHVTGSACILSNILRTSAPTAARVHEGAEGSNGPALFDLPTPTLGQSPESCTTVDPAILEPIIADPMQFHVLITTDEYPEGALRGQLRLLMCTIYVRGDDTGEATDLLYVDEGDTATVDGFFAIGARVRVTVHHDGVLVSTAVHEPATDEGISQSRLALEFEFADGDDGVWTITAEDPAIGDCQSHGEINVANSIVPVPPGGGGATTPNPPALPDTAVERSPGSGAGIAIALTGLALAVAAAAAVARGGTKTERG